MPEHCVLLLGCGLACGIKDHYNFRQWIACLSSWYQVLTYDPSANVPSERYKVLAYLQVVTYCLSCVINSVNRVKSIKLADQYEQHVSSGANH